MFFVLIAGFHVLAQETHGPRLVIEEKAHDFGKVQEGHVIEHTFRILNKGDQPLLIGRVKPG
jgi:hypothetical protein